MTTPRVLLLDGERDTAVAIARELAEDLDVTVLGAGTSRFDPLRRSRYCDVGVDLPAPVESGYVDALDAVIEAYRPDVVLPVGSESTAALDATRSTIPKRVSCSLPPSDALGAARDEAELRQFATELGIDVSSESKHGIDVSSEREHSIDASSASELGLDTANERGRSAGTEPNTTRYGCGLLFSDGDVRLLCSHEECRPDPRGNGRPTYARLVRHPFLEAKSIELLRKFGWEGVAHVAFESRPDDRFELAGIEPGFWDAYALASRYGYRFASTLVAEEFGLAAAGRVEPPARVGEMAFPLRELEHYRRNRADGSLRESLQRVANPGASWDLDRTDRRAWLRPPTEFAASLASDAVLPSSLEPVAWARVPPIANRFIAGVSAADALERARTLETRGVGAMLNRLGSHHRDRGAAERDAAEYRLLVRRIADAGLSASVTVKPSQLGLDLGEDVLDELLGDVVAFAREHDVFVWMDMEEHTSTDATLDAFERYARTYGGGVGVCVQADLKRTLADVERLAALPGKVRFVKGGAYDVPASIAYVEKSRIDRAYRELLAYAFETFEDGVAVATHDPAMIDYTIALAEEHGTDFEFQMLMGVRTTAQLELAESYDVQQFVPYGERWKQWALNRTRNNLRFVARALVG